MLTRKSLVDLSRWSPRFGFSSNLDAADLHVSGFSSKLYHQRWAPTHFSKSQVFGYFHGVFKGEKYIYIPPRSQSSDLHASPGVAKKESSRLFVAASSRQTSNSNKHFNEKTNLAVIFMWSYSGLTRNPTLVSVGDLLHTQRTIWLRLRWFDLV